MLITGLAGVTETPELMDEERRTWSRRRTDLRQAGAGLFRKMLLIAALAFAMGYMAGKGILKTAPEMPGVAEVTYDKLK